MDLKEAELKTPSEIKFYEWSFENEENKSRRKRRWSWKPKEFWETENSEQVTESDKEESQWKRDENKRP